MSTDSKVFTANDPETIDNEAGVCACLEAMARRSERVRPLSTYRVQLNKDFRFADAMEIVPYLAQLGISTLYCSPVLMARAGSMHGYDIIDHNRFNPDIGTEEEFNELVDALHQRGMTLILDVVPNHMGVGYGTNPWWQDVLQNGQASRFANYFDIDWDPLKGELRNKVLLPILGNPYGEELEAGRLKLFFDAGQFGLEYYDRVLPIDPKTYPLIFERFGEPDTSGAAIREMLGLLSSFDALPSHDSSERESAARREKVIPALQKRLSELVQRSPEVAEFTRKAVERINGRAGDPHSFDALDRVLEAQAYRLAHWRVSAEEINYRRFFDINDLVGLRMEDPQVFASTQGLIRKLLGTGAVSGLRIDHPDGLFNPPQYFQRLQMLYAASQCFGPEPRGELAENGIEVLMQQEFGRHDWRKERAPLYVVVEKILEHGEELPPDWPVAGTVGYEFANLLTHVFIDPRAGKAFTRLYHRFIGEAVDVAKLIYQSKKLIMASALSSEVNVLAHLLDEISSLDRRARDFTRKSLRDVIRETIACFPVYRTYIDERGNISERDRSYIERAIAAAKRRNGSMPANVFDFLKEILLLRGNDGGSPVHGYRKMLYFTLKVQQLTGPVMAKGLEDTTCYVYNRFVAANEVGGSPDQFGIPIEEFHEANRKRADEWPFQMLGTSTHDTKRSEDVRMRLDVLSEIPRQWAAQSMRWKRINRTRKTTIGDGRVVPDGNEEFLLYQTLVGAWPLPTGDPHSFALSGDESKSFLERVQQYMVKAVNEAKINMSWINPHQEYTNALNDFIAKILKPGTEAKPNTFLRLMHEFLPRIAFFGVVNSLAATLIKLTAPGVPDIYQGQEMFDFSLVDPDNRRPVDFEKRKVLMSEFEGVDDAHAADFCEQMMNAWTDGRTKAWVTHRGLMVRNERRELFERGRYVALHGVGEKSAHVLAYGRVLNGRAAVTVVPRFALTLMNGEMAAPVNFAWNVTEVDLPQNTGAKWTNVMTGEALEARNGRLLCREVLSRFPVALLVNS